MTTALGRISHAGCSETAECVENLRFVARRELGRGNERSALSSLERARERAPDNDSLVEDVAALAAKLELPVEAMRAYQDARTAPPGRPAMARGHRGTEARVDRRLHPALTVTARDQLGAAGGGRIEEPLPSPSSSDDGLRGVAFAVVVVAGYE